MIKRTLGDIEADREAWKTSMQSACDLGDADACARIIIEPKTKDQSSHLLRRTSVRRDWRDFGIAVYRAAEKPEYEKDIDTKWRACATDKQKWTCTVPDFFPKEKPAEDGKLPEDARKRAEEACEKTRDCDALDTMFDKAGYAPEALAPLHSAFAETLIRACMEGECTCGEATKFLSSADPRYADLAVYGCENGEAEGCYALARLYEAGTIVPPMGSDERARRSEASRLDELACPSWRLEAGPQGEYSPRACDHRAAYYASGAYPGKDRERWKYYSEYACQSPGYEWNHRGCVRLGMLWATKRASTGVNGAEARSAAWGDSDAFAVNHECKRKSVKAACDEFQKALLTVK
jgi:hypothetical protein